MKIAYVHTDVYPSPSPGINFAVFNAIGLAAVMEYCHLFVKIHSHRPSERILKDHFNVDRPKNLFIYKIKKGPLFNTNYFFYRKVYKKIIDLIEHSELHAVICRNVTFLPYLVKIKNNLGIPVFFESHDFFADLSLRDDVQFRKKGRYEKIEKKNIPYISGVICLQRSQMKWYRKTFPMQNIHIARTGISKLFQHPFEPRTSLTYIGSLDRHKGVDVLIQAAGLSRVKPPLTIIGGKDDKEISGLKQVIAKHYDLNKVTITGWINKKEMDGHLKQTAVGVLPLRNTFFNRYLTSPLKLFDFYSYGIPVIASDLPTSRELIDEGRTGIFFEPDNPRDLAEKIDLLFSGHNMRHAMGDRVYEKAQTLLWENRARQIKKIIEKYQ
ncbi:MAG: glycosyltransferase [Chitinispirillaceae bacterium]|nr:glycosyltransferase [Chitinispirillaceae bacterium]